VPAPNVDHVSNAGCLQGFADHTFSQIYASHVLEHFDYTGELLAALKEWKRVLMPGGTLYVSVPDLDVLAGLFLDRDRLSFQERFLVMRMIFGGHIDKYDYHLVGLNEEFLTDVLRAAGFTEMQKVASFGLFDDTSSQTLNGVPISVNIVCANPV
jgi:predicted SAM-dependent methyltransferase